MNDKCITSKNQNNGNKGTFALPKIGGELFKIVRSIKANVDDLYEIKDEAKRIPSPHGSLIIHSLEREREKEKNKKKSKLNRLIRLGNKYKNSDKDNNSSKEDDDSVHTTLYLFKKTLLSDNNNDDETETEISEKTGTIEITKPRSVSPKTQTSERKTIPHKQYIPSPVRQRTPSPVRQRLPSPARKCSPSPQTQRRHKPQRQRTLIPQKHRTPSPQTQRTPDLQKQCTPSPQKQRTPSPQKQRTSNPQKQPTPSPQKQRTPNPQTQHIQNKNNTQKAQIANNKNKIGKNETQETEPKRKRQLFPFIKNGIKNLNKKKEQKEKPHSQECPHFSPKTGIEFKKKESNRSVLSEKTSNEVSVYRSICDCSKSEHSLQSCKSQWLNDETANTQKIVIISHHNCSEKNSKVTVKLQIPNPPQQAGTRSKIVMTEMKKHTDKGTEATTSQIMALEEEIRLVNFSNNNNGKIRDKSNKNKNVKSGSDNSEASNVNVSKDKQRIENLKKKMFSKKANEEGKIAEKSNGTSRSYVSNVDEVKPPRELTKSVKEQKKIANEAAKSTNELIKSANGPEKSTKRPEKPVNEAAKFTNGSEKSVNESEKYATEPIESTIESPESDNVPARFENLPVKSATLSNNKKSKNPNANEKQRANNPSKFVPVLKWDKRVAAGKVNGLASPNVNVNKSKNSLGTKRIKSVYHNMCTVSKAPLNEDDALMKPSVPMPEELRRIKTEVDQAVAQKKVFTVCGNYYSVRKALIRRGWVEKMRVSFHSSNQVRKLYTASMAELLDLFKDKEQGWLARRIVASRMLANQAVDLFWDYSNDIFKHSSMHSNKYPLINRLRTGVFGYSSKSGLCDTVKRSHWYQIPGVSCLSHPRTYNFAHSGDPRDFLEDYKRTAAMSVLKWIVERSTDKVIKLISNNGKIPLSMFEFALVECKRYIKICKHKDIDMKFAEASDYEWHQFFEHFYALIHLGEHFKNNDVETVESLVLKSKIILAKVERYFPYLEMDNTMNIWILKPCNGCRGIGIHLCRTLEYILTIVKNNTQRKYVIQKYIERPLLIHNTKFDIRQWFLISNTNPLTLWIYKECYIRLSSQTFNIRKLHESIHLTNNSIQARYRNSNRDPSLPNCNMWTLNQFKKYLDLIGHPNVFDQVIFPGMKQNITCAILANEHRIYRRKNTFEIYGSDFMITEDFKPWLLEINCRPALYGSTAVTAKLCPKVLEDTIKLMIDHERDKKPNTSNFELLYKEKVEKLPHVDPGSFVFHIRPLTEDFFVKPEHLYLTLTPEETKEEVSDADLSILSLKSEMKTTLERLLGLIKTEKEKRTGFSSDSLVNNKLNKEVQIETNTLDGALKDVTVIMNLDQVKLPYCTNNINSNKCLLTGGMQLGQNKTFDEEFDEEDDDDESDVVETSSAGATKEIAKSMISGFLHQLEKLE